MAKKRDTISLGSEQYLDFSCTPCSKEGIPIDALKFCLNCDESFCVTCLRFHNKFEVMRNHRLFDIEECPLHAGKVITMYRSDDDTLLCSLCKDDKNLYENVDRTVYITECAKRVRNSHELADVVNDLAEIKSRTNQMKERRNTQLNKLEDEKEITIRKLKSERERINNHYDILENASNTAFETVMTSCKTRMNDEITNLDKITSETEDQEKCIKQAQCQNDSQLFVKMKQAQAVLRKNDTILSEMIVAPKCPKFVYNNEITEEFININSLGEIRERVNKSATLLGQYNVKTTNDQYDCNVTCVCFLDDGSVLLVDNSNTNIKHLDTSFQIVSEFILPSKASAVCTIGLNKVAIAMYRKNYILLATVSDDGITINRHISTSVNSGCYGIAHHDRTLIIGCSNLPLTEVLLVCDLEGKMLRVFNFRSNEVGKSYRFCHIAVSENGNKISVANTYSGIMSVYMDEREEELFADKDITGPEGVCVEDDGSMIICGNKSNNVVLFDSDEEKCILLTEKDGINQPKSVTMRDDLLIVTMYDKNEINVYRLK